MPTKNGLQLQDQDIELLHLVYQLRIATLDQIAALSGRSVRALWGRLLKLKQRRYLASVARFMLSWDLPVRHSILPRAGALKFENRIYNGFVRCRAAVIILIAIALIACGVRGDANASILLFNGAGTSGNDVQAVEAILKSSRLHYSTVNSSTLNGMSESQIRKYRLLIVPGGNFVDIGNSLSPHAVANVRNSVQSGLNYLGICAGGFFAGNSPYNGLNLTSGVRFGFYAAERQGLRKAAVAIASAGAPTLDHYWEDGPEFTGWGAVVGKYPDGTPAIVEGTFGSGWVLLSGVHPEAPAEWRRGMTFATPADIDHAYAATLIQAALNRVSLAHY